MPTFCRYNFNSVESGFPSTISFTETEEPVVLNPRFSSSFGLTDTNLITGVSINTLGGVFNVNNQAGFGDIVTIKFNVSPGLGIASSFNNQIDPITFQTTVSLRGYTEIR
mgnify:CR=1 FL=1